MSRAWLDRMQSEVSLQSDLANWPEPTVNSQATLDRYARQSVPPANGSVRPSTGPKKAPYPPVRPA